MKSYRVCVDVTIRRVIDILASDKLEAQYDAECIATNNLGPDVIKEVSSEIVEDDGTEF